MSPAPTRSVGGSLLCPLTEIGLDIWVERDGSWRWKDEDHLELAVDAGVFSAEEAAAFRAEGERVLAEWPLPTGWEDWRADPSWPVPAAPADWAAQD